jgi:hypothetical protein
VEQRAHQLAVIGGAHRLGQLEQGRLVQVIAKRSPRSPTFPPRGHHFLIRSRTKVSLKGTRPVVG